MADETKAGTFAETHHRLLPVCGFRQSQAVVTEALPVGPRSHRGATWASSGARCKA